MYDVAVAGGGIAGLTVAYRLGASGVEVVCLEAAARAGGCVGTDRVDGFCFERGAQNVLEPAEGPVWRLARDLGLEGEILYPRERKYYLASRGRLFPAPAQLPRVLSMRGLLRAGRGLVSAGLPGPPDEPVAAWARRRFGEEVASRIIDPMVAGVYAGDPDRLSLEAAFPDMWELDRKYRRPIAALFAGAAKRVVYSFRNGMGTLVEALAYRLGTALRTGVAVTGITAGSRGYRIEIQNREAVWARNVIVAVPAVSAARLLRGLDAVLADLLGSIRSAPVTSAAVGFSDMPVPPGYGMVRPQCEGARMLGCLFCSSAFGGSAPDGRVLVRMLFGGARDPEALELNDAGLVDLVCAELRSAIGVTATPEVWSIVRHRPGLPQYEAGHLKRLAAIDDRLKLFPGLHLVGNSYRGISVSRVVEEAERLCTRFPMWSKADYSIA